MSAPRNRTLTCTEEEIHAHAARFVPFQRSMTAEECADRIVCQDIFDAAPFLPKEFVDLLILDPPYNLTKEYGPYTFSRQTTRGYAAWFTRFIEALRPCLKETATVYVCSDWKTSTTVYPVLESFFTVRNRITWEREKGRGAQKNWKNNTEDIWFCTVSEKYYFDLQAVKLRRRVIAPYRTPDGSPKDWSESMEGNFRLTCPSNIWTDLTVPFWSMRENTPHPTQKPEKLLAKLILASSRPGDFVFDPTAGSGTTGVVARKLNRRFCLVEYSPEYCAYACKRLENSAQDRSIQGYEDGIFRERNS